MTSPATPLRPLSLRAHIGRAMIAFAVLLPVGLILAGIYRSRFFVARVQGRPLSTIILIDGGILAAGLLLQRGEDR